MSNSMIHLAAKVHQAELYRAANDARPVELPTAATARGRGRSWRPTWPTLPANGAKHAQRAAAAR